MSEFFLPEKFVEVPQKLSRHFILYTKLETPKSSVESKVLYSSRTRVSSKQKNFDSNRNKICFCCFMKPKTNRTVSKQTETNRHNPKSSEKYQNMLSINLFRLVFCLFRFNRNIETLCFGIEAKQPKLFRNKPKLTETNRNNTKFSEKNTKICSLSNCFGCSSVCFGSIETPKLSVTV
jgi:hypothetical protein